MRAGILALEQPLQAYPWSSYPFYLRAPESRPVWLRVDSLLGEWGIPMDTPAGRAEFAGCVEARRRAEGNGDTGITCAAASPPAASAPRLV